MNVVYLQFGTASLDSSGLSPLIVNNPDILISDTALIGTPDSNIGLSFYEQDISLYAVESTVQATASFNYLIASSR